MKKSKIILLLSALILISSSQVFASCLDSLQIFGEESYGCSPSKKNTTLKSGMDLDVNAGKLFITGSETAYKLDKKYDSKDYCRFTNPNNHQSLFLSVGLATDTGNINRGVMVIQGTRNDVKFNDAFFCLNNQAGT